MTTKFNKQGHTAPLILLCVSVVFSMLMLLGCGGGGGGGSDDSSDDNGGSSSPIGPADITVSWTANRESAVNSLGGGYRVYYSQTPNFSINTATMVDVPYSGGAQSPTSTVIPQLPSGTYYFKVVAYSDLNTGGSTPSQEGSITIQ